MAMKISISFKNTKKDIQLYEHLMSLDDKSAEIKNILRNAYKDKLLSSSEQPDNNKDAKKDTINVTDF